MHVYKLKIGYSSCASLVQKNNSRDGSIILFQSPSLNFEDSDVSRTIAEFVETRYKKSSNGNSDESEVSIENTTFEKDIMKTELQQSQPPSSRLQNL
jgi:hypothetical protein